MPVKDFESKIKPVSSGLSPLIKIMIYGDPGTEKTRLAGTSRDAIFLDPDEGTASAAMSGSTAKRAGIRDYNDLEEAVDWLREGGYKKFHWVWFDSITLFQELGLDQIMEDLIADPTKRHRKVYAPDKGEFGQNMNRLSRYCRQLKALPTNVGFICHAMPSERTLANGDVIESMMPTIQGRNMSEKISGYMDIVAHMQKKQKDGAEDDKDSYAVLSTRKIDGWYGKDRFNAIGRMAYPTIPKIEAKISEALKAHASGATPPAKRTVKRSRTTTGASKTS